MRSAKTEITLSLHESQPNQGGVCEGRGLAGGFHVRIYFKTSWNVTLAGTTLWEWLGGIIEEGVVQSADH